ncbi:hypothetical protein K402DRAFT_400700 [Aulographum hederae CBS 113979]|uniref:Uncharacterized protein n=1 Tax=Aulographum hederae CBS 113979 TaxID=1176131 RepID=A0A6G1HDZ0_9PEZI|nr:hypothetical protein K402DRAFT_400700 [Aulographum hederae CBS 113979]
MLLSRFRRLFLLSVAAFVFLVVVIAGRNSRYTFPSTPDILKQAKQRGSTRKWGGLENTQEVVANEGEKWKPDDMEAPSLSDEEAAKLMFPGMESPDKFSPGLQSPHVPSQGETTPGIASPAEESAAGASSAEASSYVPPSILLSQAAETPPTPAPTAAQQADPWIESYQSAISDNTMDEGLKKALEDWKKMYDQNFGQNAPHNLDHVEDLKAIHYTPVPKTGTNSAQAAAETSGGSSDSSGKQANAVDEIMDLLQRYPEHEKSLKNILQQLLLPSKTVEPATTSASTAFSVEATPTDMNEYMKDLLTWYRPADSNGHDPPYDDFVGREYDPNRWESFDNIDGYYSSNGIKLFVQRDPKPFGAYLPYPDYNGPKWKQQWKGEYVSCTGPSGRPLNQSWEDVVFAYQGIPQDWPEPFMGSYEAIGLDKNICIDRAARYSNFGLDQQEWQIAKWAKPVGIRDWKKVNWGELQEECLSKNQERYAYHARKTGPLDAGSSIPPESEWDVIMQNKGLDGNRGLRTRDHSSPVFAQRTAVLIRTWEGYEYTENDIHTIRAMISELSLRTGGEYQVFLFVNVKDRSKNIHGNKEEYQAMLRKAVPKELRSIAILWNEDLLAAWYPEVGDWQVYWNQFMPLQWFSLTHPEFDFVWNWEMDARYTSNHYHFLSKIADFALQQPRKYQWERISRYYIPSAPGHGGLDYSEFVRNTHSLIAQGVSDGKIPTPIWGPAPYSPTQIPLGPEPPHPQESDNFEWGVGEEADLITLLPVWDPRDTQWDYRKKIWNFIPGVKPKFTSKQPTDRGFDHPEFPNIDRRVIINTMVRFSRDLLRAMHEENRVGRTMQAEMWPATVALHHGFKIVYAPHPIFSSKRWPGTYADAVFNAASPVKPKESPIHPVDKERARIEKERERKKKEKEEEERKKAERERQKEVSYDEESSSSSSSSATPTPTPTEDPFANPRLYDQIPGRWGQGADSIYNPDREHNFHSVSWYYYGRFGRVLWRRWMGWQTDSGDGMMADGYNAVGTKEWEDWNFMPRGRMCLPGVLVHPIKRKDHADGDGGEKKD